METRSRPARISRTIGVNDDSDVDRIETAESDDGTDGGSSDLLRRLLSPESAPLLSSLAGEIVAQLSSTERTRDLASMSRRRYAATQCVTLLVALLAVVGVLAFAFTTNGEVVMQILNALNATSAP